MIYQIHFPTLAPVSVLRLRISLDRIGFCKSTASNSSSSAYHVYYMIINQETMEYAVADVETPDIPVVEWTNNLCTELELVPIEMWEPYIAGAINE